MLPTLLLSRSYPPLATRRDPPPPPPPLRLQPHQVIGSGAYASAMATPPPCPTAAASALAHRTSPAPDRISFQTSFVQNHRSQLMFPTLAPNHRCQLIRCAVLAPSRRSWWHRSSLSPVAMPPPGPLAPPSVRSPATTSLLGGGTY